MSPGQYIDRRLVWPFWCAVCTECSVHVESIEPSTLHAITYNEIRSVFVVDAKI